jgi:hypothetical protein
MIISAFYYLVIAGMTAWGFLASWQGLSYGPVLCCIALAVILINLSVMRGGLG